MIARAFEHDDRPREDHIVVIHGATWADYQRMLEIRGDKANPRFAYREGRLEITSPSHNHESIKSFIGRLVETYCLERGIDFNPVGSWTLENKAAGRGVEPDECYVFGPLAGVERPDLAIEVVWTSGGIDKLDIYRALGVREVWIWRAGRIGVWLLGDEGYAEVQWSAALPGIDLALMLSFLDRDTASAAMRDYRAALRQG